MWSCSHLSIFWQSSAAAATTAADEVWQLWRPLWGVNTVGTVLFVALSLMLGATAGVQILFCPLLKSCHSQHICPSVFYPHRKWTRGNTGVMRNSKLMHSCFSTTQWFSMEVQSFFPFVYSLENVKFHVENLSQFLVIHAWVMMLEFKLMAACWCGLQRWWPMVWGKHSFTFFSVVLRMRG